MNFNSLKEIIEHFGLDAKNKTETKRALKSMLKKDHPDKNQGEFENSAAKEKFLEITQALDFLDDIQKNQALIPRNQLNELTKIINGLTVIEKDNNIKAIEKKEETLNTKIKDSVKSFQEKNIRSKITSTTLAAIITFLWLFPETIAKKKELTFLLYNEILFTSIWLGTLILTGLFWIFIRKHEAEDRQIKSNYNIESTQNFMFGLFIKLKSSNYQYERIDSKRKFKFSKDDFVNFLNNDYRYLSSRLQMSNIDHYNITNEINYINTNRSSLKKNEPSPHFVTKFRFGRYFPKPGEITLELAQTICELILERLLTRDVITKSDEKSLSEQYIFFENN